MGRNRGAAVTGVVVAATVVALLAGEAAGLAVAATAGLVAVGVERHARRRPDPRRRFSPAERRHVMDRDGWRCRWCGSGVGLEVDHVVPWSRGGRTSVANAQVLCRSCNASKGAR